MYIFNCCNYSLISNFIYNYNVIAFKKFNFKGKYIISKRSAWYKNIRIWAVRDSMHASIEDFAFCQLKVRWDFYNTKFSQSEYYVMGSALNYKKTVYIKFKFYDIQDFYFDFFDKKHLKFLHKRGLRAYRYIYQPTYIINKLAVLKFSFTKFARFYEYFQLRPLYKPIFNKFIFYSSLSKSFYNTKYNNYFVFTITNIRFNPDILYYYFTYRNKYSLGTLYYVYMKKLARLRLSKFYFWVNRYFYKNFKIGTVACNPYDEDYWILLYYLFHEDPEFNIFWTIRFRSKILNKLSIDINGSFFCKKQFSIKSQVVEITKKDTSYILTKHMPDAITFDILLFYKCKETWLKIFKFKNSSFFFTKLSCMYSNYFYVSNYFYLFSNFFFLEYFLSTNFLLELHAKNTLSFVQNTPFSVNGSAGALFNSGSPLDLTYYHNCIFSKRQNIHTAGIDYFDMADSFIFF